MAELDSATAFCIFAPCVRNRGALVRHAFPFEKHGALVRHAFPFEKHGALVRHAFPFEKHGALVRHAFPFEKHGALVRHAFPFEKHDGRLFSCGMGNIKSEFHGTGRQCVSGLQLCDEMGCYRHSAVKKIKLRKDLKK